VADAELDAKLAALVADQKPGKPVAARDPVNQPMIRHWCDAMDDQNPVYTDPEFAEKSIHDGIVAPPTMLQAWTMRGLRPPAPPKQSEAGDREHIFGVLDAAGFTSVVATNCVQEYRRYVRPGDHLSVETRYESVSPEKRTALGVGHFVTQRQTYRDAEGEEVATMLFRILKFKPGTGAAPAPKES
jgi:acyl dehydratase